MKQELRLRIIVTEPLSGVWFAMQRGKSEPVAPTSSGKELVFDFSILADLVSEPPPSSRESSRRALRLHDSST